MDIRYLKLTPGFRTALVDGTLVPGSPKHMATEDFYKALPGSRIHLCEKGYLFAVAIFSVERDLAYIYSYAYAPEENWARYTRNLAPDSYGREDFVFTERCWFSVCIRREDGADLTEEDDRYREKLLAFSSEEEAYEEKACFTQEIRETVHAIDAACAGMAGDDQGAARHPDRRAEKGILKLCLLTDTHYTVNGTWEDTCHNIRRVAEKVDYDGIIHLGDLTDGMLSKERTAGYVRQIIRDLEYCRAPVYITPGNHDSNYFRNRENAFTAEEMKALYRLYGSGAGPDRIERESAGQSGAGPGRIGWDRIEQAEGGCRLDYHIDLQGFAFPVRLVFLSSFDDGAPIRYGYTDEQLAWLEETLYSAEEGTRFLIFSHDAPLAQLDYWSFYIRNGERLLDILEGCNAREQYQIVGFFYGHVHADQIYTGCSFPVLSTGCAKLEYFLDKKPKGAIVYKREADTVTQDLWDSMLVDLRGQQIKLIRFGAGEDREVSFAKRRSTWRSAAIQKRAERKMKIWAHRGASGHAPENTLPAFELAHTLGADGIELDVQLTKDGVPVVIHDERVDRVSDGRGSVKDFCLEELRTLDVGRAFPAYGRVTVPTLAEVYDLVKKTDMTVNLELKNSAIFYEGLEENVLKLAEEKGLADRIVYSSFNHHSMARIKKLLPTARIAFLYSDGLIGVADYGARYGVYAVHPSLRNMAYPDVSAARAGITYPDMAVDHTGITYPDMAVDHAGITCPDVTVTAARAGITYPDVVADRTGIVYPDVAADRTGIVYPDVVKSCHARGIRVHVWTVNEEADIQRMGALGADAVITNYVERG